MSAGYITKDSGEREEYDTGAHRDTARGKGRFDLLPPFALKRVADLYERGAVKYDDMNWTRGIPSRRFLDSALRHLIQYAGGARDEDHLAGVVFNVFGLMYNEDIMPDQHDLHDWSAKRGGNAV